LASTLAASLDGEDSPTHDAASVEHSKGMDVLARLGADPDAIAEFCRRNSVRRLAVFGSALRDDFTPESDVDVLVDFLPGAQVSLFDMTRMEMELEEIVPDHRVDLRTAADLGARFCDTVVAEAEVVYSAREARRRTELSA
jgi:predicted nucleotidyltransferase